MDTPELQERAVEAVAELIRDINPGAMAQRFALLIEVIDVDGERATWMMTPPDQRAWDSLGLLAYATQVEQAGIVADRLDGDG